MTAFPNFISFDKFTVNQDKTNSFINRRGTIFTCFILQFMGVWNDFLTPLYLSSKSKLFPMTMSVYQFFGRESSYWNYVFADIVLTIIPVVVVYVLGQRYIIGGVTAGAVKG